MASSDYDGSINIDTRIDTDAFIQGVTKINESLKRLETSLNNLTVTIRKAFNLPDINTEQVNNMNAAIEESEGKIQRAGEQISAALNQNAESNVTDIMHEEEATVKEAASNIQTSGEKIRQSLNHDVESTVANAIREETDAIKEETDAVYEYVDQYKNVANEIEQMTTGTTGTNEQLARINELNAALKDMQKNGMYFGDDEYDEAYIELMQLTNTVNNYRRELQETATSQDEFYDNLNNTLLETRNNLASLSGRGMGFGNEEFDQAYQEYVRANAALRDYRRELEETATVNENENAQTSRFSRLLRDTGNSLNKLGVLAASGFKKMWSAARKAFNAITGGSKKSKKGIDLMNTGIGKAIKKITRMAKTALFFRIFRTGFTNLRNYLGELLKSNELFTRSLAQTKGNLKTAFMPVYDAIMPAINVMMAGLQKLAGYLAQITTTIFGKSIKSMQSEAKALDKVGNSAKEANKQLGKYDDLNVITKKSDSSSGEEDIGSTYGNIETSGWLDNLLNEFKNGNYEQAGREIASKINNALQSIDWSSITETAGKIGTHIAEFLNGGIDELDFTRIGKTLGNGLNTAIEFALRFVEKFDFSRFGEQISNGINGTFNTVNWTKASVLITKGLDGIVKTLRKTVQGIDWENIGISAGTLINGLINVDWGEVGGLLSDTFIGLFDFIIGLLEEIDWEQLGADIVDFIIGIDWLTLLEKLGNAIILYWKACIKLQIGYFKEIGNFIINGLLQGIIDVITGIGTWLKEHVLNPIVNGVKSLFGIHSPSTVMAELGGYVIEGFLNGIESLVSSVKNKFEEIWNSIKSVFSISNVTTHFNTVCNTIKGVFEHIPQWFKEKFTNAWENVKNVFSKGGKIFSGIKDGIADTFKKIVNTLIDGINKVVGTPFEKINSMLNSIRNISVAGVKPFKNLWSKNPISVPKIPHLASGAVIPPNKQFLAVLGDQRNGTNIEAPAALIKKMAKEAVEEADISGDVEVIVNLYVEPDAEGIFKVVRTEYKKEKKRKPNNPVWE